MSLSVPTLFKDFYDNKTKSNKEREMKEQEIETHLINNQEISTGKILNHMLCL